VLDVIQRFVDSRAEDVVERSVVVALDEREDTIHPEDRPGGVVGRGGN
jgi:hypothetical protein